MTLSCQIEDYMAALPELKGLYPAQWDELGLDRERGELDPQHDIYEGLHARGALLLITLRDEGSRLVGYFLGFVLPSMHARSILELTTDFYRVLPEFRGRFGGVRLIRTAIAEAKRRGCHRFTAGTNLDNDASRLFAALGFKPLEVYHSLWLAP